jgi:hypothetical protein
MVDKLFASETLWKWGMLKLRREVGWEEDWPCGERVINVGYNRVGIEGGEVELCGQGGGVRGRIGETYLWREKESRKDLKDGL